MGSIIGGQVYALIGGFGWRYVFFAGVAPALLLLLIRRGMVEPEHFQAVRERRRALATEAHAARAEDREFLRFVPLQLFNKELRFNTFVGLLFALGTLLAIWTTVIWLPTIQSLMLEKEGIKGAAAAPIIGRNMMLWGIGGIFGYACFGFIADLIGRRPTVAFYNTGTLVLGLTLFLAVNTMAPYPYLLLIYGFFVLGVFSGHAVYIPELFPTHVRATAVSFCNGGARVITSFGAAGSRPPGCSVWRELQQTRRADDLLCPPEHLCDVSRPRDPRRPAATLTEKGPRRGPGGDCEWRHSRHLVDQAVELTGILADHLMGEVSRGAGYLSRGRCGSP